MRQVPAEDATARQYRVVAATLGIVEDATDALLHGADADAVTVAGSVDALRRTAEAGGDIAEVAVGAALREQCLYLLAGGRVVRLNRPL